MNIVVRKVSQKEKVSTMLSHIHNESSSAISEKITQTRMDARLVRRVALHHTIHLKPAPAQIMIFNDQDRAYEQGYVMEPLVLKKDFVAAGAARAMDMRGEASADGECGGDEYRQELVEDEDSAWLNDRILPRQAFVGYAPILKEQSVEQQDQQTLTCWL